MSIRRNAEWRNNRFKNGRQLIRPVSKPDSGVYAADFLQCGVSEILARTPRTQGFRFIALRKIRS
jgi:hypothetical protein